jgi:hypothetical protein
MVLCVMKRFFGEFNNERERRRKKEEERKKKKERRRKKEEERKKKKERKKKSNLVSRILPFHISKLRQFQSIKKYFLCIFMRNYLILF